MATSKQGHSYASLTWGTIRAVFNKLGGIPGAQQFLRGEKEVVPNAELQILKRHLRAFGRSIEILAGITTGKHHSVEALISVLTEAGCMVTEQAREHLTIQPVSDSRHLVVLTTYQLIGNVDLATFAEILRGAKRLGLELCEPEDAAQLYLSLKERTVRLLRVVAGPAASPQIFELSRVGGVILDAINTQADLKYAADQRWVFRRPM